MPSKRLRAKQITPFLTVGTAAETIGGIGTPFFTQLTDNATPDYSLNENYSGGAVDAYFAPLDNCYIKGLSFVFGSGSAANFFHGDDTFLGLAALTNGLKFGVKNGIAGNVVLDLTVTNPLVNNADLMLFTTSSFMQHKDGQATAGNNSNIINGDLDFTRRFGAPLYLPSSHIFVCTLQDDLSTLTSAKIAVSGFYL